MRRRKFVLVWLVGSLAAFLLALCQTQAADENMPTPDPSPTAMSKLRAKLPRMSPQLVELLRKQADERKAFYNEQAKTKIDLKAKHIKERQELLATHRTARAKFMSEKHSGDERASFFNNQRQEMKTLKTNQKQEYANLVRESKEKIVQFHAKQRQEKRQQKRSH